MTDRATVRIVVAALATGVILGLVAMAYLAATQTPIPDPLDRLTNLLAGGLIGVLASTRSTADPEPPTPVVVENQPNDPVPVEAAPETVTPPA